MGDKYVVGQAGAVGPNSMARDMTFQQVLAETGNSVDMGDLAQELSRLRQELSSRSVRPEDAIEVAAIAEAEIAATNGNEAEVTKHLARAGKWALSAATAIGTAVAAAAIKAATGL